jgi:drug/metabolite transporter (DMT)-like permease
LLLAFSVPLTYSIANVLMRRGMQHLPAIELTSLCLAGTAVLLLPLALWMPSPTPTAAVSWSEAWGALAILGVLGTGIGSLLFNRLVQEQGPLFAAMVTNLVPIGAMAWGWADAEEITARQLGAVLGVLAMVLLVQFGAAKKPAQGGPRP